jgi:hypothetical protein
VCVGRTASLADTVLADGAERRSIMRVVRGWTWAVGTVVAVCLAWSLAIGWRGDAGSVHGARVISLGEAVRRTGWPTLRWSCGWRPRKGSDFGVLAGIFLQFLLVLGFLLPFLLFTRAFLASLALGLRGAEDNSDRLLWV